MICDNCSHEMIIVDVYDEVCMDYFYYWLCENCGEVIDREVFR